jgi:hypothetical protein
MKPHRATLFVPALLAWQLPATSPAQGYPSGGPE